MIRGLFLESTTKFRKDLGRKTRKLGHHMLGSSTVTAVSWAKVSCKTRSSFSPSPPPTTGRPVPTPIFLRPPLSSSTTPPAPASPDGAAAVGSAEMPDRLSLCFCNSLTSSSTILGKENRGHENPKGDEKKGLPSPLHLAGEEEDEEEEEQTCVPPRPQIRRRRRPPPPRGTASSGSTASPPASASSPCAPRNTAGSGRALLSAVKGGVFIRDYPQRNEELTTSANIVEFQFSIFLWTVKQINRTLHPSNGTSPNFPLSLYPTSPDPRVGRAHWDSGFQLVVIRPSLTKTCVESPIRLLETISGHGELTFFLK